MSARFAVRIAIVDADDQRQRRQARRQTDQQQRAAHELADATTTALRCGQGIPSSVKKSVTFWRSCSLPHPLGMKTAARHRRILQAGRQPAPPCAPPPGRVRRTTGRSSRRFICLALRRPVPPVTVVFRGGHFPRTPWGSTAFQSGRCGSSPAFATTTRRRGSKPIATTTSGVPGAPRPRSRRRSRRAAKDRAGGQRRAAREQVDHADQPRHPLFEGQVALQGSPGPLVLDWRSQGLGQLGFFFRLTADRLLLGAGMHRFEALAQRYRAAVLDERKERRSPPPSRRSARPATTSAPSLTRRPPPASPPITRARRCSGTADSTPAGRASRPPCSRHGVRRLRRHALRGRRAMHRWLRTSYRRTAPAKFLGSQIDPASRSGDRRQGI